MIKSKMERIKKAELKTRKHLPHPPSLAIYSSDVTEAEAEEMVKAFDKQNEGKEYAWDPICFVVQFVSPRTHKVLWKGDPEWDKEDEDVKYYPPKQDIDPKLNNYDKEVTQ